jgi:hypothetical protein
VAVPRLVKKRDVSLNAVHVLVARRLAARFCCVDLCGCLLLRACVCVCLAGLRPRDWLVLGSVHTVLAHAFLARLPAGVQVGVGLVLLGGEFGVSRVAACLAVLSACGVYLRLQPCVQPSPAGVW